MLGPNQLRAQPGGGKTAEDRSVRDRGPLRLVKDDAAPVEDAGPAQGRQDRRLSIGPSLAVWAIMAVLAWGVIAVLLRLF